MKKNMAQVTASVKRFKTKYGQHWKLRNALDRYWMRNSMETDATEYLLKELDKIETALKRA